MSKGSTSFEGLRALVDAIDGIVWEADARTFRFSFVSEQAERILGYPLEEWTSNPTFWKDHIHPDDRDEAVDYCVTATRDKKDHRFEYRMVAADGHIVWLLDYVTVTVEDDEPAQLMGVMIDITASKTTEKNLAEAQAVLLASIEQSPAGILIADAPDVTIRVANSAALGIRGEKALPLTNIPVELHPQNWQTFYPDGSPFAPEDLPLSRAVLNGETSHNVDVIIRRPDGEKRWVLGNAAPVRDADNNVVAGVVVFPDVTELKSAEKARDKGRQELEKRVEERTAELRALVNTMAGREVRMAELKEVIRRLKRQIADAGMVPVADDPLQEDTGTGPGEALA